jgi:hypothetical protein
MATSTVVPSTEIIVKKRAFDLSKFERVSLETKVNFVPVADMNEALARVGNEPAKLVAVLNAGLRRNLIAETKASMGSDNPEIVFNTKAINTFINLFRAVPPYVSVADRKEQTGKILAWIRSQPELLGALKAAAAVAPETDDDDEEENEA